MKLTSYIRFDSLILPILFFFSYDTPGASGSVSGIAGNVRRAYPGDIDGSPYAHTGNICRMRNYRSPDAQLQITGCAQFGPETLPQAPRRLYGKKKNIGNICGSNRTYDVNFIF